MDVVISIILTSSVLKSLREMWEFQGEAPVILWQQVVKIMWWCKKRSKGAREGGEGEERGGGGGGSGGGRGGGGRLTLGGDFLSWACCWSCCHGNRNTDTWHASRPICNQWVIYHRINRFTWLYSSSLSSGLRSASWISWLNKKNFFLQSVQWLGS